MCTISSHGFLLFAIILMDFVREIKAYATKFRAAPNLTSPAIVQYSTFFHLNWCDCFNSMLQRYSAYTFEEYI